MKPQQLLLPKKMERPCAWPMLYLEINGNDNDDDVQNFNKHDPSFVAQHVETVMIT